MKLNSQKVKSLFLLSLLNSVAGKSKNATNQTKKVASPSGKKTNSLPKLAANLTAGENNSDPTLIFAGIPMLFRDTGIGDQGRCVTSFAIVPTQENNPDDCTWFRNTGFLTSTLCCKNGNGCGMFSTSAGYGDDVIASSR